MTKNSIFTLAPLLWGLILPHVTHATINTATNDALSDPSGIHSSPFTAKNTALPVPPNRDDSDITTPYYKVDAGSSLVCAIRNKDRGIDCWGTNDFEQLNAPKKGKFKLLSAGQNHACAINTKNQLSCWGSVSSRPNSTQARGLYLDVSSGDNHTCAIRKGNNTVTCWGDNTYGQTNAPKGAFKVLSARSNQACAIRVNGQLACWGDAAFTGYTQPVGSFSDISIGKLHACATRRPDGSIICWGNGIYGSTMAPIGTRFKSVLSGDYHTCAIRDDQSLVCWGRDQFGQVSGAAKGPLTSVGAGGALTCMVDPGRQVSCKGSFAYNDVMYGSGTQLKSQALRPQLWGPLEDAIYGAAGYGLLKWGESMEEGSTVQTLALFVAGILGAESDPNEARFREIQKSLEEISQQLGTINQSIIETQGRITQGACQTALTALQTSPATDAIITADASYRKLISDIKTDITNQQKYGSPPSADIANRLNDFAKTYLSSTGSTQRLIPALSQVHRLLTEFDTTSALVKCVDADLGKLRAGATHPFDDRQVYTQAHDLLDYARVLQIKGSVIVQDLNAREALKGLTDSTNPAYPESPPIPSGQVPSTGLCGEIKRQVNTMGKATPDKLRWLYSKDFCVAAETSINDTYKRLVQQIEYTGAPYTDENVVLSMGNKIFKYGNSATNWLWLRPGKFSLSEVSYKHSEDIGFGVLPNASGDGMVFSGFPVSIDQKGNYSSINFAAAGDANWYSSGDAGKRFDGIWHGAGQAWSDIYSSYDNYLETKNKRDGKEGKGDVISMMAEAKGVPIPSEPDHLFPNVSAVPYWMTGQYFNLEWNRLAGDDRTSDKTLQVRCFVAAEINPTWYYSSGGSKNPKETLRTTGKVCSSEEFAGMSRQIFNYNQDGVWYSNGMRTRVPFTYPDGDKHFKPYESLLGGYYKFFRKDGTSTNLYFETTKAAVFFNDGTLPHYPVLDVSKRACFDSIVKKPVDNDKPLRQTRSNMLARDDGAVSLPTRCGKDMDRFISQRVPRPSSVPADDLRKDPPPPDVVNP